MVKVTAMESTRGRVRDAEREEPSKRIENTVAMDVLVGRIKPDRAI